MPKWKEVIDPFKTWQYLLLNLALGAVTVLIFGMGSLASFKAFVLSSLWSSAICFTLWTGNAYLVTYLDRKIHWIEQPKQRFAAGLLTQSLYSLVAFLGVQMLMRWLIMGEGPGNLWHWVVNFGTYPVLISLGISAFFTTIGFFNAWRDSERKAARYEREMLTYKYEALRNQINPHFLFNSFNVLSDLVHDEPDLAVRFIQQLSDLYRYVLDSRNRELVPLQEELAFLDAFSFLLKTRFEEKLHIEVDVPHSEGEQIVPMALQLLVENAVKHNEVSRSHPLTVTVRRKGNRIEVKNNLKAKNVGDTSKKTGLKTLKAQYAFLGSEEVEVQPSEKEFFVSIPILQSRPQ